MKITGIESVVVRIPYHAGGPSQAEAWGGKAWTTADALLVRVTTDADITGWGEAFGYNAIPATKAAIDQMLAPLCIGQDALAIEELMLDLQRKLHIFGRGGPVIFGLSGIDIALWDIAGKAAGQPVHKLLGGGGAESLSCYASLIRYTDPEIVAANVRRAIAQGYRHIKLHETSVEANRAARDAAGADIAIMLDVNCPWSLRQALEMADRLREFNLYWLEEPVWPPEDFRALAELREKCAIPIAAGENAATVKQFQHLLEARAIDFLQPSPAKMGGITELRKVYSLASTHNVTVVPHTFYEGPAFLAGLHVNGALAGDPLVEWRFFELEQRLYGDAIVPHNGAIALPQKPGLGFDPDPEVVRRYRSI